MAKPGALVLMTFMIGDLQFELDVIANIGVLPHQELNTERELAISQLFMKCVVRILCEAS